MTSLGPQVLHAIAIIRSFVRTAGAPERRLMYQVLLGLSLQALAESLPEAVEIADLGQSAKPSHSRALPEAPTGTVRDRWISPREGALRLNVSLRTLRRRARKPPYCAFCIPQEHGFKVSELALDEYQRRERERARR